MDAKILQLILNKTVVDNENENETANENNNVGDCEQFPVIKPEIIDKLSKAFTKLLSYKVPKELYQRYAARLNVIETLRNWSRLSDDWSMHLLPIFQDAEYSSNFLIELLSRHLTPERLMNSDNVDSLVEVAEVLLHVVKSNNSIESCCISVIERILTLEQSEKSKKFLQDLVKTSDDLNINSSLIEKVYIVQRSNLIEKPLTDCFMSYCSEPQKENQFDEMDSLFEHVVDSPLLFQMVSYQLKEFFVMSKYAEKTQKFIQSILERIQTHCDKYNKDTLDLYSSSLQFCVILLRIKPSYHTENSKNQTIHSLKQIFLIDYNDALILVSHFPEWLPDYLNFFEKAEELSTELNANESNIESKTDEELNIESKSDEDSMDVSF